MFFMEDKVGVYFFPRGGMAYIEKKKKMMFCCDQFYFLCWKTAGKISVPRERVKEM